MYSQQPLYRTQTIVSPQGRVLMETKGTQINKTSVSDEYNERNQGCTVSFGGQTDLHPHVRYAEDGEEGTKQYGKLQPVHDPIPDDAVYASPVYLLTEKQRDQLDSFVSGWELRNGCIATKLQDQCEAENRVLYPVLIESDDGDCLKDEEGGQIQWEREFVAEYLPVSIHDCQWYFSGGRSVHCHVPLFTTKDGIDHLKEVSKDFYGELDSGIYSRKRQFRLPGVAHSKTGQPKTPIEPEWEDERIGQEVVTTDPERPETYADLVRDVYGLDVLDRPTAYLWNPSEPDEPKSEPHLWEPGMDKPTGDALGKWQRYNRHAYCPHAKANGGTRSMALITYKGGAYSRDGDTYLPSQIWMAIGCDGEPWHEDGNCPVKLSKPDYRKLTDMGVEPGNDLLVIGGRNHRSRIFQLNSEQENTIWYALHKERKPGDDHDREDTLQVIRDCGFEPGSANRVDPKEPVERESGGPSEAATLQSEAERRGIDTLTHPEQRKVANRLLRVHGFGRTVEWFKEQFRDDFDRERTIKILKGICGKYDDLPNV